MPKFVIDESGERCFACTTPEEAAAMVAQLVGEGRVAYIAAKPAVVVEQVATFVHEYEAGQALRVTADGGLEVIDAADMAAIEATHDELEALEALIDKHRSFSSILNVDSRYEWLFAVLADYSHAVEVAAGPSAAAGEASGSVSNTLQDGGGARAALAGAGTSSGEGTGEASNSATGTTGEASTAEKAEILPADVGAQQVVQMAAGGLGTGNGELN